MTLAHRSPDAREVPKDTNLDPGARAAADRYIAAAKSLTDRSLWPLKMFTNVNLFLWHLDAFEGDEDPMPLFVDVFTEAAEFIEAAAGTRVNGGHFPAGAAPAGAGPAGTGPDVDAGEFESMVSGMFSEVWLGLSDDVYFDESYDYVQTRLRRNHVNPEALFGDKVVLDAGCGSGKFSAAIARCGAAKVIGMDIGEKGLAFARAQAKKAPYGERLDYRTGSAFDLPLKDGSVDMVWSNGVIHLTLDYEGCLREFARVIKPGGMLFLYVNGRFGLFELLFDTLRISSEDIPRNLFQHYLAQLGINSGRIYWMMCAYYGPYQWKAKAEVEALLTANGFTDLRQLTRGLDIDQIEQVTQGIPYAAAKYGEAQLKYLARRDQP